MTRHCHHGHGCCGCRGCCCEACDVDEALWALGALAMAPLVVAGAVLRSAARYPLAALMIIVAGVVALVVAGVWP